MSPNLYYFIFLSVSIITAFIFIFLYKNRLRSLNNPAFIAPLILEAIDEAIIITNSIEKKFQTQLQEKTKKLADINNLIENMKQCKKIEEDNIEQKIQEITFDIHEEHTRLYTAVKNLNFGFIIIDKEKNIIITNNAADDLFSIPPVRTNINFQNLQIHTRDNVDLIKNTDSTIKNGNQSFLENIHINNKYVNIFISPIITLSGTTGAVILTEDRTEKQITQKSKEDFYTIASHELRTPLTAIRDYIAIIKQLYLEDIKNEELKNLINDIDTLSARLINIVNDFLDTPKLEQGKINIKKEPCDLIEIIKACINETSSIATPKNLSIKLNDPLKSMIVLGDKEKIRQILINLISNGIKYTEQGGITINVEKTLGSRYKISIQDTGKGIPKENIKFLFNKFQRTDPTRHMTSTGLGLYISRLLVEKMNGTITLENSEEGKGSTFSFTLPIYEQMNK
ncbi:ATP-binding protein [Patescibacteria group bacterium]|nr:ATP-binding protein [Patescibacteria group bacterium]